MKRTTTTKTLTDKHSYFNNKWFARWAPYYDIFDLIIGKLRKVAAKTINIPQKSKVLDVATGTGSQAVALAEQGYDVTGIDLSPDMLNQAKKKTKPNLKLRFLNLDATNLPFDSRSFDGTSISLGLHDMPHEIGQRVLMEIKRVVKKDGQILIVEHLEPINHWFAKIAHPFIRIGETPNYVPFVTTGLESILKKAGLTMVSKHYWRGLFQVVIAQNL